MEYVKLSNGLELPKLGIFDFTLTDAEMDEIFDMDMNCSSLPQEFEPWFVERICGARYGMQEKNNRD